MTSVCTPTGPRRSPARNGRVKAPARAGRRSGPTIVDLMSTIDPALVAALDIRRERRAEFDHDPAAEHTIWQTSSIDALLDGAYDGDLTLGELAAHGDLGIGTVQHLDGELIVIDGQCFRVAADGTVHRRSDGRARRSRSCASSPRTDPCRSTVLSPSPS